MKEYLDLYLCYRRLNIKMSRILGIKRDRRIEFYLLTNIKTFSDYDKGMISEDAMKEKVRRLREGSKSFVEHYRKRGISVGFKGLDLMACRILVIDALENGFDYLNSEVNELDNVFSREYLLQRIGKVKHQNQQDEAVL